MVKRFAIRMLLSLLKLMALMPYGLVASLGDALGWLLYKFPSRRRHIVRVNLAQCFPDLSDEKREEMARQHFRHAIRSYVERSIQWFGSSQKLEKLIEVDSEIDLNLGLQRPTILLGFHFVALEAGAIFISRVLKRQVCGLYQPFSDPLVDDAARTARTRLGGEIASRANGARTALRWLREGKLVMLASDMDFGVRNSAFVPFFGVPACTLTSVGRLAAAAGAQVVPFTVEVLPRHKGYRLKIFKPWDLYPSGCDHSDARRMNGFLEDQISLMCEQYYWMHRRFKTRPPGEPDIYEKPVHA
jgi:KDO2-lipid IV(A) lauroyltransferase